MLNQLDKLNPEAVKPLEHYARKLLELDGQNIICLAVYGSATGSNFVPGKSNVNLAVAAKALQMEQLKAYLKVTSPPQKQVIVPLFLTQGHILSSLDTFPIELLEIRDNHVAIFGQDIFAGITVDLKYLRLQCERELKSRLIRLRQAYLEVGAKAEGLNMLLIQSFNSILPIMRSLIYLCNQTPKIPKEHLLPQVSAQFGLDDKIFKRILELRGLKKPPSLPELESIFGGYLQQLEHLAQAVDKLTC